MGVLDKSVAEQFSSSRFNVDAAPAHERYDLWQDSISCIFDVDRSRTQRIDNPFSAEIQSYMIGPVMLSRTTTREQSWRRSPLTIARDGMDHYMLQLYQNGRQKGTFGGGDFDLPQGGMQLFDLSQDVRTETSNFTNLSLIIPRPYVEGLLHRPDDQHMRIFDLRRPMVDLLRSHMLALFRNAEALSVSQALSLAPLTRELLALCLNDGQQAAKGDAISRRTLLSLLRQEIDSRLQDPTLNVASLCKRFQLSRSKLYEMMQAEGGVTACIRKRRLSGALQALISDGHIGLSIGDIARRFCFSESDFSRAFRTAYGMSPRAARHYGREQARQTSVQGIDRRYERWLHGLTV